MQKSNRQESSGFLKIVTFVMVIFIVGYFFSCTLGSTTLAKDTGNANISTVDDFDNIQESPEDQGNTFAGVETSIAQRAISGWNSIVGDSNNSLSIQLPEKENKSDFGELVASGYENNSTTNTAKSSILSFANSYILPSVYQDISTSPYQDAITILYSNGILQSSNQFYPNNYVRISDFIRVVMDTYRVQLGYESSNLVGLTNNFYLYDSSFDSELLSKINSAYELGFLQSIALKDENGDLRLNAFITPQEANNILLTIQKKSPSLINNIKDIHFASNNTLRKDEMAELVVSAFNLKLNEGSLAVFSDISGSPYQKEIQLLAKLGIVGGVNGKFYPDAKIENQDFVIMIVRALMRQSDSQPTINNFYYLTQLLNDSYNSTYSPYLEFCLESQICNSLLSQESNGVSFQSNRLLSQGEITSILSTATKNKLIFAGSGEQLISRGEVAKLIVEAFDFDNETTSESTNSTGDTQNLENSDSPSNENALSSLWNNFQSLMKIS